MAAGPRAPRARQRRHRPGSVLALLVAIGIGLHNFGEGLAIGAAFALGEAALGTLLIVGFTLHNTTEGLAIVAPLAKERPSLRLLAQLGLIGGVPTIAGAWLGGFVYSPVLGGPVSRPRRRRDRAGGRADCRSDRRRRSRLGALRDRAGDARAAGRIRRDVRHGDAGRMMKHYSVRAALLVVVAIGALALVPRVAGGVLIGAGESPARESAGDPAGRDDMTFYVAGRTTPNPTLPSPAGERVRIVLSNDDLGMSHDFAPVMGVRRRILRARGRTRSSSRCPIRPASHPYSCSPHAEMMRGTIVVRLRIAIFRRGGTQNPCFTFRRKIAYDTASHIRIPARGSARRSPRLTPRAATSAACSPPSPIATISSRFCSRTGRIVAGSGACRADAVRSGTRVLDLACGTGDITYASRARGPAPSGSTSRPACWRWRRDKRHREARRRGSSRRHDGAAFRDGHFDVVTTGYGIRNVPVIAGR